MEAILFTSKKGKKMNSSIDETSVSCQLILTPEELQIILAFRLQKQLVLDRAVPIETISAETDSNNMEIHCSNLITKATEASTHTISIQTSNTEIIKKGKKCINTAKTQNFQSGLSPFYRHAHFNQSRMSSQFGIVPKQVHRVYSIGGKILPSETFLGTDIRSFINLSIYRNFTRSEISNLIWPMFH